MLLIPPTYGKAQQNKASSSCPLPAIQKGMGEVGHPSPVGSAMHALVPPPTHPNSISPLGTSPNPKDGSIAAFNELSRSCKRRSDIFNQLVDLSDLGLVYKDKRQIINIVHEQLE